MSVGAVILAAGGSTRLGQPKQFLKFEGESLVRRAVAAAADCDPVVVVAGDHAERMQGELSGTQAVVALNPNWRDGLGTSIRCGVQRALVIAPEIEALVLMVCDQPFVTRELISAIRASGKSIAASAYAGTLGVPALFSREHFPKLLALPDTHGAKHLLTGPDVAAISFPAGKIDIDTPAQAALLDPRSS